MEISNHKVYPRHCFKYSPQTQNNPGSLFELSICARNLPHNDGSKMMTRLKIYIQFEYNDWEECGQTEEIWDSVNPDFERKVLLQFRFEKPTNLCILIHHSVIDVNGIEDIYDGSVKNLSFEKLVIERQIEEQIHFEIKRPGLDGARLIITAEELMGSSKGEIHMQLKAINLDKKNFFVQSDPFVVFLMSTESGNFQMIHKTPVIKKTLNPSWDIVIPLSKVNGDLKTTLKIECWNWNYLGYHKIIGEAYCSLHSLITGQLPVQIPCLNPNMMNNKIRINLRKFLRKSEYENSGLFEFVHCQLKKVYTFGEYLRCDTKLHSIIAIDFSESNGDPNSSSSMHYIHGGPTYYEEVMRPICHILEKYNIDQKFDGIGFGAKLPGQRQISHVFHLNHNQTDSHCSSASGILEDYRHCLSTVQLAGPSNLAPCIHYAIEVTKQVQTGSRYYVLLILTDGIVSDLHDTKKAIEDSSNHPLSIIIVGIGNENFDSMEELNARRKVGLPSQRKLNNVQFICFKKYYQNAVGPTTNPVIAGLRLAQEVLHNIPEQFMDYMRSLEISPDSQHIR